MNERMALNLIAEIMGWGNDEGGEATREYAWLRLMSAIKYDGYADFRAGIRFVESLASWLLQFRPEDRRVAYAFVKNRLVYISPPEMQRLIEAFVPEVVTPAVRRSVAPAIGCEPHEVWGSKAGKNAFDARLRRTLFVGMSDGSRIDVLRRANAGRLSQEQVVPMINVDDEKWRDLGKDLVREQGGGAKFESVYLIDDFTASGTTFIRRVDGEWKGKLKNFNAIVQSARGKLGADFPLRDGYSVHIHHYISSSQARRALCQRMDDARAQWAERTYASDEVTEGLLLPDEVKLGSADPGILDLCERYYDHRLFLDLERHCRQAGQDTMKLGYGDCALPIVLEHNTPNNSIPLLWAETSGSDGHAIRPLFYRRARHG